MRPPQLGERVGSVEGVNQFGQPVRLGEADWSLLFFFPYAFSGICSDELDRLQTDLPAYAQAGCRVAGVSCDPMFALRVFADGRGLGFDLLTDHWPHGALAQHFGVFDADRGCAVRGSFLLDGAGVLCWSVVNPIGEGRDLAAQLQAVRELTAPPLVD